MVQNIITFTFVTSSSINETKIKIYTKRIYKYKNDTVYLQLLILPQVKATQEATCNNNYFSDEGSRQRKTTV